MLVACQWIKIHHEKFSLTNLDRYYKIAYKIPSLNKFDQNIDFLQQCQQTFNKVNNVWRSQKRLIFNLAWATLMLSCHIFTINILYFVRMHFKGSNIEIHWIWTFFKTLNHFVSMISTTLRNSKWCLRELKKKHTRTIKKSSNLDTISKFEKTNTTRFILLTIQCCPII
jgi:hypothetical protein